MTTVSIIGGGRWARTIANAMASLPSAPDRIVLHSRNNAAGVRDWINSQNLQYRVHLAQDWPNFDTDRPDAVVVASRAADHVAAASAALDAHLPTLVEKPIAIGAEAARQLCARAGSTILAASHVFLFARYLETFAESVARHGVLRGLEFVWQDGEGDIVRGEVKSYDPAVTVFDDVLPHVVPVLARLCPAALSMNSLVLAEGGAQVTIGASAGEVPLLIRLARNASERRRILKAETDGGTCTLDFSVEPGTFCMPGVDTLNGDPLWGEGLRPLGSMLAAFLAAVRGGALDSRLLPDKALASAVFADAVRVPYRLQRREWAEKRNAYALREISSEI